MSTFAGLTDMFMKLQHLAAVLMLLSGTLFCQAKNDRLGLKLDELDSCIVAREAYDAQKQSRINGYHAVLGPEETWGGQDYDAIFSLFEEYKSFKYDSAYFYANELLKIAEAVSDPARISEAQATITFCYLSSGLFKEASDMIGQIDSRNLTLSARKYYYDLYNRLYFDMADYSNVQGLWDAYVAKGGVYADSLMAISSPESQEWKYAKAQMDIKHGRYQECIRIYRDLIDNHGVTPHERAMINSSIGCAYRFMNQLDSAKYYLAEAAIWDIRSSTKETTALYLLAELLCNGPEAERSYNYIHAALEDADFYNARHRKLSINPILPVIEKARMDSITRQRNYMVLIIVLCVVMLMVLVCASVIVLKQNASLKKKSRLLAEASKIKDEYIGHSFYVNSEFIAETEELYKTINQKIIAHQYDDLRDLSRISKVNKRRESMYASFDKCFLSIFPTFVREYAKLFPEGEIDAEAKTLTSEMRIFALIRLGITDSERIAKFLNYSVHTIYTYKTRVKTRSIVSNDEFEARIKAVEMGK